MRKPKSKTAISFEPTDAVARSLTYAHQVSGVSIDDLINESVLQGLNQVVSARARLLKEFNLNNVLGPAPVCEPQPSVPPPSAAPPPAPAPLARTRRHRRSRASSNGAAPTAAPAPAPKRATRPGNRKPGRPKGSKNKPKDGTAAPTTAADPTSL